MFIICVATYLYLRIVTFHMNRKIRRENNTYRKLSEDPASVPPNCYVSYEQETRRENNIQRWLSEDPARICLPSVKLLFHDQWLVYYFNGTLVYKESGLTLKFWMEYLQLFLSLLITFYSFPIFWINSFFCTYDITDMASDLMKIMPWVSVTIFS
jgi:hypothetical protein